MLAVTTSSRPWIMERLAQVGDDRARDVDGDVVVGDVVQHDDELVATEPRNGVDRAPAGAQPLGHLDEQLVARGVTERIVDRLEAVEVDEQHRRAQAVTARALANVWLSRSIDQRAVRQTGERVVQRPVFEGLLGGAAFGDVAHVCTTPCTAGSCRRLSSASRTSASDRRRAGRGPRSRAPGTGR